MYSDGTITNEFTGYYDGTEKEYVYPTARQNAVIAFKDFYLSAQDGDLTTDGLTVTTSTGGSEDITVGNATSAVLSATVLNPDGYMDGLTWGDGRAYIGVVTSETDITATLPDGTSAYVNDDGDEYIGGTFGMTANGTAVSGISGEVVSIVVDEDANVLAYTADKAYDVVGTTATEATEWASNSFIQAKYGNTPHSILWTVSAFPEPKTVWNLETGKKVEYTYMPMGVFDCSNVDAHGATFVIEAYDHMTDFDADATDWVASLDFTTPKTIATIIRELMAKLGKAYTISADAVNTTVTWSKNPITNYTTTYRQILQWLAEAIGCNVRMERTGEVEFYTFGNRSVATVTADRIVNNSRTKNHYTVPAITKVVCYNTLGAGYSSGVDGSVYYIAGNPFVDPSANVAPLTALLGRLDDIPAYYPTNINVACADPRIDCGDLLTVTASDGSTPYAIPIMSQTLHWNGLCTAEITATGQQVRSIPDSMESSGLSDAVASNPSAVISMIEAEGISADWITSGRLTVRDDDDNIIFDADKDAHQVEIAGFSVNHDRFYHDDGYTQSSMDPYGFEINDSTNNYAMRIDANGLSSSHGSNTGAFSYGGVSLTSTASNNAAYLLPTRLRITDGTDTAQLTPSLLSVKAAEIGATSKDYALYLNGNSMTENIVNESITGRFRSSFGEQYLRIKDSGTAGTAPPSSGEISSNALVSANGFYVMDNTSWSPAVSGTFVAKGVITLKASGTSYTVTPTKITDWDNMVTNGVTLTDTQTLTNKTLTAPTMTSPVISSGGVCFPADEHSGGSNTRFHAIRWGASASGSSTTITMPRAGVYIIIGARINNSTTTNHGLWILQAHGTTSSYSAVKAPTAGAPTIEPAGLSLKLTTGTANYYFTILGAGSY